jgi:hypothetical protein
MQQSIHFLPSSPPVSPLFRPSSPGLRLTSLPSSRAFSKTALLAQSHRPPYSVLFNTSQADLILPAANRGEVPITAWWLWMIIALAVLLLLIGIIVIILFRRKEDPETEVADETVEAQFPNEDTITGDHDFVNPLADQSSDAAELGSVDE